MEHSLERKDSTELQGVLDALDDPDCRGIIGELREPRTAREVAAATEIPLSTTYRKLELLSETGLLEERIAISDGGNHSTRYAIGFEAVEIALTDRGEFEVSIERPEHPPDEQLSYLWSEVRKET